LRFGEEREALEDSGDVVHRAAAHLVGVVLETAFPVLMIVDLAVAEQAEQPLDFCVADSAAEADAVNIAHRHEDGRVVRDDPEMIKAARCSENRFLFDALDDPESMVRVNDLVADFKCHESPCQEALYMEGRSRTSSSISITHLTPRHNAKSPEN